MLVRSFVFSVGELGKNRKNLHLNDAPPSCLVLLQVKLRDVRSEVSCVSSFHQLTQRHQSTCSVSPLISNNIFTHILWDRQKRFKIQHGEVFSHSDSLVHHIRGSLCARLLFFKSYCQCPNSIVNGRGRPSFLFQQNCWICCHRRCFIVRGTIPC